MGKKEVRLKEIEAELRILLNKDIEDFEQNIRNVRTQKRMSDLTKEYKQIKAKKYWK